MLKREYIVVGSVYTLVILVIMMCVFFAKPTIKRTPARAYVNSQDTSASNKIQVLMNVNNSSIIYGYSMVDGVLTLVQSWDVGHLSGNRSLQMSSDGKFVLLICQDGWMTLDSTNPANATFYAWTQVMFAGDPYSWVPLSPDNLYMYTNYAGPLLVTDLATNVTTSTTLYDPSPGRGPTSPYVIFADQILSDPLRNKVYVYTHQYATLPPIMVVYEQDPNNPRSLLPVASLTLTPLWVRRSSTIVLVPNPNPFSFTSSSPMVFSRDRRSIWFMHMTNVYGEVRNVVVNTLVEIVLSPFSMGRILPLPDARLKIAQAPALVAHPREDILFVCEPTTSTSQIYAVDISSAGPRVLNNLGTTLSFRATSFQFCDPYLLALSLTGNIVGSYKWISPNLQSQFALSTLTGDQPWSLLVLPP